MRAFSVSSDFAVSNVDQGSSVTTEFSSLEINFLDYSRQFFMTAYSLNRTYVHMYMLDVLGVLKDAR